MSAPPPRALRVETPDGHGRLELTRFHAPSGRGCDRHAPANTPGIRLSHSQSTTSTPSLRYEDIYRLCYIRGPEGIIAELAGRIG